MPLNPQKFRLRRAFQKGVPYFSKFQESEKKRVPYSFRQNQLKSGRRSLLRGGVFIYNCPVLIIVLLVCTGTMSCSSTVPVNKVENLSTLRRAESMHEC